MTDTLLLILAAIVVVAVLNIERHAASVRRDLGRMDRKLTLMMTHMNLSYDDSLGLSDRVKELARQPHGKISAIKVYREETGAGLAEAKQAVEDFIASASR